MNSHEERPSPLRVIDSRFVLPNLPESVELFGCPREWRLGFETAGTAIVGPDSPQPSVAVAYGADSAGAALSSGADQVIAVGSEAVSAVTRSGWPFQRYLAVPNVSEAEYLVPSDQRSVLAYFADHVRVPPRRRSHLRNRGAVRLLPAGALARIGRWEQMAVAAQGPILPEACAGAAALVGRAIGGWFVSLGKGPPDGRVVFTLFEPGAPEPVAVSKVRRLADMGPVRNDVQSRGQIDLLRQRLGDRVPSVLGAFDLGNGSRADVEEAAVGTPLIAYLSGPFSATKKWAAIDAVAKWLLELSRPDARAGRGVTEGEERNVRNFRGHLPDSIVEKLARVPRVLEHGDLWSANVIYSRPGRFSVIDWDYLSFSGLALRDLVGFLGEASSRVDGAVSVQEADVHFVGVFSGSHPSSVRVLTWIRRAVSVLGVNPLDAGALIGFGLADLAQRRREEADQPAASVAFAEAVEPSIRRAKLWFATPGLGYSWHL